MKYKKTIAFAISVVIIVSSFVGIVAINNEKLYANPIPADGISQQDRKMAEDIANLTGTSVSRVLELRAQSGSWNSVMDKLQNINTEEQSKAMSDEKLEQFIVDGGYSSDDVLALKSLVQRIISNLNELTRKDAMTVQNPVVTPGMEIVKEEEPDYKNLLEKFEKNLAIYYALKLESDFGSFDAVIDEYLYCLQAEVDFGLYLTDKEAYDKAISEKAGLLQREKAITGASIEEAMLKQLQNPDKAEEDEKDDSTKPDMPAMPDAQSKTPDNPMPKVEDPRPKSPAADVMKEIEDINSKWMP